MPQASCIKRQRDHFATRVVPKRVTSWGSTAWHEWDTLCSAIQHSQHSISPGAEPQHPGKPPQKNQHAHSPCFHHYDSPQSQPRAQADCWAWQILTPLFNVLLEDTKLVREPQKPHQKLSNTNHPGASSSCPSSAKCKSLDAEDIKWSPSVQHLAE